MKKKKAQTINYNSDQRNYIKLALGENVAIEIASRESLDRVKKEAINIAKNLQPNPNRTMSNKALIAEGIQ